MSRRRKGRQQLNWREMLPIDFTPGIPEGDSPVPGPLWHKKSGYLYPLSLLSVSLCITLQHKVVALYLHRNRHPFHQSVVQ
jgi:hypothetical protein